MLLLRRHCLKITYKQAFVHRFIGAHHTEDNQSHHRAAATSSNLDDRLCAGHVLHAQCVLAEKAGDFLLVRAPTEHSPAPCLLLDTACCSMLAYPAIADKPFSQLKFRWALLQMGFYLDWIGPTVLCALVMTVLTTIMVVAFVEIFSYH